MIGTYLSGASTIIAQDTHLRGRHEYMNFVDSALMAVFGKDMNYMQIGAVPAETNSTTNPNRYQGNYFLPGTAEVTQQAA